MALDHLNRYNPKRFRENRQNFVKKIRKIDVQRGMSSVASIFLTPRTLFTKNRGGRIRPRPAPGGRGLTMGTYEVKTSFGA